MSYEKNAKYVQHAIDNLKTQENYMNGYAYDTIYEVLTWLKDQLDKKARKDKPVPKNKQKESDHVD